jgi:hypothetical protein
MTVMFFHSVPSLHFLKGASERAASEMAVQKERTTRSHILWQKWREDNGRQLYVVVSRTKRQPDSICESQAAIPTLLLLHLEDSKWQLVKHSLTFILFWMNYQSVYTGENAAVKLQKQDPSY